MTTLTQLNTPAARAVVYSVASGILAMFGAGAAISQESFNAWYTVVFAVIGIVPLIMAALHVHKGTPAQSDWSTLVSEVPRSTPATPTLATAIEAETARWQGQAQEILGQAQGVAQSTIGDAIGRHRTP